MKIGIIGAGNMGGAIARGLASSSIINATDITVCSPNNHKELDALTAFNPAINVSTDNAKAIYHTDLILVAVKPWLLDSVLEPLIPKIDYKKQAIISIVAGFTLDHLANLAKDYTNSPVVFRLIPNTAIAVRQSMTFIAAKNATQAQIDAVKKIFDTLGKSMIVEERLMSGGTALASCGIAYVMRYIRAASEGGVELGFYANQSKEIIMQTMLGAVELLEATGNNPEVEIDKVTTPGGITIKGLNAMEANGFTTAVIEGLKASK
ncbi:MAG: pyrroline-5-carboxylate reductase [Muribaculaceae bacterium]